MRQFFADRWNGNKPPYIRDRCDGFCEPSTHYHVAWPGLIGHALILLNVLVIVVLVIAAVCS